MLNNTGFEAFERDAPSENDLSHLERAKYTRKSYSLVGGRSENLHVCLYLLRLVQPLAYSRVKNNWTQKRIRLAGP